MMTGFVSQISYCGLRKKEDNEYKYYQLFIEPKGDHLLEVDKWKEDLLLRIQNEYKAILVRPK